MHGIAGAGSLKKVGRVGVKAIVYFEVMTTIALLLGIALAYIFQPGVGMNIDHRSTSSSLKTYLDTAAQVKAAGMSSSCMKLIPTTFVGAFSSGDVSAGAHHSIAFGCALSLIGDAGKPVNFAGSTDLAPSSSR